MWHRRRLLLCLLVVFVALNLMQTERGFIKPMADASLRGRNRERKEGRKGGRGVKKKEFTEHVT